MFIRDAKDFLRIAIGVIIQKVKMIFLLRLFIKLCSSVNLY